MPFQDASALSWLSLSGMGSLIFDVEPEKGTLGGRCSQALPVQSSALPPPAKFHFRALQQPSMAAGCAARCRLCSPLRVPVLLARVLLFMDSLQVVFATPEEGSVLLS